jgi:SAM-dependent methyltransferase
VKSRSERLERLDVETPTREELAPVVGYLAFVNRWLGGTCAVARHLEGLRGPVIVLDVAGGAGDICRTLARRFPDARMVVLDRSEEMLSFARGMTQIRGDGLRLPFADKSVDYVTATHFFHHLKDDEIVAILKEFDRVARRGIIVNDLLRRRRALAWIRLLTLFANPYVRSDGPLSVRRGFTVEEVRSLASRAGLGWLTARVHFGHRFTLAGERPRT